jgi:chemotaxis protein MotB
MVPKSRLASCQSYVCQLQRQNRDACAQLENLKAQNQELANRNLDAQEALAARERELEQRYGEWDQERDEMRRLAGSLQGGGSPLPRDVRRQLEEFAREHPGFVEVDADAGISKFSTDVLFPTGRAELSQNAEAALADFAKIFKTGSGRQMNIMVVGHTDKQRIAKRETLDRYPTNWDLSAARALAVQKYLEQSGVDPRRLGFSGFGEYQPVVASGPANSPKNRRVEIYVLAPDAPIAGRAAATERY